MMLRQQCKIQGLVCQAILSLGQLRLVPKVWARGQLDVRMFRYNRITIYLQKNKGSKRILDTSTYK
jgi:hypothetical protein